jgi:hypothetical protein
MQATRTPTVTLPSSYAAQIARLLERCANHEDERARGRVTFPIVVVKALALEAHHWARYLETSLPPADMP